MIATKWGKCAYEDCGISLEEKKEFLPQVDMFNPKPDVKITPEMAPAIIAWRDEDMFCARHRRV